MRSLLSIFSFKNRDHLTAIVLFAAMVLVLEVTLSFLPEIRWAGAFRGKNMKMPPQTPAYSVMGDSVAASGILAKQMTDEMPGNPFVFNSALAGSGPEFAYFILKRQIAAGRKPEAIVYAPSPHTFGSRRVALLVGGFCTWREIAEVAGQAVEPFEVVYGVACKLSYTLRYREQLAQILRGSKPSIEPATHAEGGAPHKKREYPSSKIHAMYKKEFQVNDFNHVLFEKFLALARQNNVPVYWATMPVLSAVHESRKPIKFEEDYFHFIDELCSRYSIQILHKEFLIYEDDFFVDQTHLDGEGAQRFTKSLAETLAAKRTAPIQPGS